MHSVVAQLIVGPLFLVGALMCILGRKRFSIVLRATSTQKANWTTSPTTLLVVGIMVGVVAVYCVVDALLIMRGD